MTTAERKLVELETTLQKVLGILKKARPLLGAYSDGAWEPVAVEVDAIISDLEKFSK